MSHIYLDVDEHIQKLMDRECDREALIGRALQADYPDLKICLDSNSCMRYVSQKATPYTDKIEFQYGPDKRLEVWVYLEDKSVRVFADPPCHIVGHRRSGYFGVVPTDNWEEKMTEAGYGKDILRKVKDLLDSQKPASYLEEGEPQKVSDSSP